MNVRVSWMLSSMTVLAMGALPMLAQSRPATSSAKPINGHPNLNGIWRTMSTANWDIEDHASAPGPYYQLGAVGAVAPGRGIVEGGEIPYKPEALKTRNANRANRWKADPELKCYMPGIPRAHYMPYPFQIVQSPSAILMAYQYAGTNRTINMGKPMEPSVDTWMGTSNGHWEGDTLVIDNRGFNDLSWFDRSGNFHSDALHVVERFQPMDRDHLRYEALIEDPQTFTRPWKLSFVLYRDVEPHAELVEFKCIEFSEELLYGDLTRKAAK